MGEVSFFEPDCWMYFYACPSVYSMDFDLSINHELGFVGINDGHVSTKVVVSSDDCEFAARAIRDFRDGWKPMTVQRLARLFAAFRNNAEMGLIRQYRRTIDQRIFDTTVFHSALRSLASFFISMQNDHPKNSDLRSLRMKTFSCCQQYAGLIAERLHVTVYWHNRKVF